MTTGVAAFDFDGTLSTRDNLAPFLRAVVGPRALFRAIMLTAPHLARAAVDDERRDIAKVAMLRRVLGGREYAEIERHGVEFSAEGVRRHLRDDMLARLQWHREEGHMTVLVSAALGSYLRPVGAALGVDAVLATELAVGDDGRVSGELAGANVRRREKVRRLEAWMARELAPDRAVLWAYGDSAGDRELLARADYPVRITRRAVLG